MKLHFKVFRVALPMFLLFAAGALFGQEAIFPLKNNPVLIQHTQRMANQPQLDALQRTDHDTDTLCLPFLDDFSNPVSKVDNAGPLCNETIFRANAGIYPSNAMWVDSGAFVNTTYPLGPPTYGVATLDGLNKFGKPYSETAPFGPADTLTSRPIDLSGTFIDSIYLSFFVQPGGRGNSPESNDSLVLEFKRNDSTWASVWGEVDATSSMADSFKIVMVPVADPDFWHDAFQFRFRNYATRDGNNDHWHIDFVYLDENRTVDDFLFRDVAFTQAPKSLLKNYQQMPWRQLRDFQSDEMVTDLNAQVRNNFNIDNNTSFVDTLRETYSGTLIEAGNEISFPVLAGFYHSFDHTVSTIPSATPNYNADSFLVDQYYVISPSGDFNNSNDTIRKTHSFYNYYAYDDGTAEVAYGLIGTGARLAMRHKTNVPDTIFNVYMHWAYNNGSNNSLFFSLIIWDEIDTTGGSGTENILYQEDFNTPKYIDSINGFYVYELEEPIPVDGFFYVGWLQSQTDLLNIGFDRNTNAKNNTFFDLGNGWTKSSLNGSVMIRPQLGPNYQKYPLPPFNVGLESLHEPEQFTVYPNPTDAYIYPQLPADEQYTYSITDMTGRELQSGQYNGQRITTTDLADGMYLLQMADQTGRRYQARFLRMD